MSRCKDQVLGGVFGDRPSEHPLAPMGRRSGSPSAICLALEKMEANIGGISFGAPQNCVFPFGFHFESANKQVTSKRHAQGNSRGHPSPPPGTSLGHPLPTPPRPFKERSPPPPHQGNPNGPPASSPDSILGRGVGGLWGGQNSRPPA